MTMWVVIRPGNMSLYLWDPARLTCRGTGAGRTSWKNRFAGTGYEHFMRDGCGLVDFETRVPTNPQCFVFKFFF